MQTYLLTGIRNIRKRLAYALINILGLTLGLASCLVIFLIVRYELSYDASHHLADRTYRVNLHALDYNPRVSPVVGPALRSYFPELEQMTQVFYIDDGLVKVGDQRFNEKGFAFADAHLPQVFDYVWLQGDARTALAEPNSMVLTESSAKKYFGSENAMGGVIKVNDENYKVTGVIRDLPGNEHLQFHFLLSWETIRKDFGNYSFYSIPGGSFVYIVLPQGYSVSRIERRIKDFISANWGKDLAKEATLVLQPLRDIHFDQRYLHVSAYTTTSRQTYWALAGIAVFIIIIACINFVNLATGLAATRAKEVGVRKVLGARRPELIRQFLGETTVLVLLCVGLGLAAAGLLLPVLDTWLDIHVAAHELLEPRVLGMLAIVTVVVVLLAGLYPAFVQSAFLPVLSLKGVRMTGGQGLTLRKGLVVVQFAISQLLIVGTLVVARQMDFFQNRDLGFDKELVVNMDLPDSAKGAVFLQSLATNPGVSAYSLCSASPVHNNSFAPFHSVEMGMPKDDVTEIKVVDERYTRMFGLHMLAGDTISRRPPGDSVLRIVINQTLLSKLHLTDPAEAVGRRISFAGQTSLIIGVVQDFQSESKHMKRRALGMLYDARMFYNVCVRLRPQGVQSTLTGIGKTWSRLFPSGLFEYEFLDDHIANEYRQEQKVYTAFRLFSAIAILIGCLGLYGLVAFAAVQRTREVGIRKVLGAGIPDIVLLFAREFILLIAVAFVVAAPTAWLVMHNWLQNFAYQIGIGWGTFVVAIIASFAIAAITISWESVKAAVVSPVKSLRTE